MKVLADLNRFWDGKPIHVDRRQSESYLIDGVRLSVSLMIQEPALREFFRQSKQLARGTGFLARFLISWPSSMIGQRFYKDPPKGWPALSAFHQRMEHLLSKSLKIDGRVTRTATLELDDQARNRWISFMMIWSENWEWEGSARCQRHCQQDSRQRSPNRSQFSRIHQFR